MSNYAQIIESLQIFQKYETQDTTQWLDADHDMLFAGPSVDLVSKRDHERLLDLGWNSDGGHYSKFV